MSPPQATISASWHFCPQHYLLPPKFPKGAENDVLSNPPAGASSMVKSPVTPNSCLFNICFSSVDTQVIGIDSFILHCSFFLPESVATLSLSTTLSYSRYKSSAVLAL
ncbi:hypothetical protein MAP00_003289 [Monascus purpureus]|nr:hypothetical protein MAP00_003289 [Monascus purpureus]